MLKLYRQSRERGYSNVEGPREVTSNQSESLDDIEDIDEIDEEIVKSFVATTWSFPESIYGMAMISMARSVHQKPRSIDFLLWFTVMLNLALQGYILYATHQYVCNPSVVQARDMYLQFEEVALIDGKIDLQQFDKWDDKKKLKLCQIPFAHPFAFMTMLLIWTATVLSDISETVTYSLAWLSLPRQDAEHDEFNFNMDDQEVQLLYSSTFLKLLTFILILIPKAIIACVLWWLGARWLSSTMSLQDVVINTVALSFIMDLDEVVYYAFVPRQSRERAGVYKMRRPPLLIMPSLRTLTFILKIMSCIVVPYLYINYFQQVLPHYHWDLVDPCQQVYAQFANQANMPFDAASQAHHSGAGGPSGRR